MTRPRRGGKWYCAKDCHSNLIMSQRAWMLTPKRIRESEDAKEALMSGRIQIIPDLFVDESDPGNLYCKIVRFTNDEEIEGE